MQTYSDKTLSTSNKHLAIDVQNVTVKFGKYSALKNINFTLDKGSFLYVVGPNGSGKTTLIRLMIGILKPTFGSVSMYTDSLGYLPQKLNYGIRFPITVREVIYSGFKKQAIKQTKESALIIEEWLEKMEIKHLMHQSMATLSGGQQQRVYLIRALINKPDMLILDEPTSALDPVFRRSFYELIDELHRQGTTIVYVTHDLHDTIQLNAKILYIDQEIKYYGTYRDYYHSNGGDFHV